MIWFGVRFLPVRVGYRVGYMIDNGFNLKN
jgi:hypothetical protein